MNRLAPFIILPALCICTSAHAMTETSWSFRGTAPKGIVVHNLTTVEIITEGMFVRTATDGFITLPSLTQQADTMTMTVTNVSTPKAALIWRTPELRDGEYYQADIDLPVGQSKRVSLALHDFEGWDWTATTLGIAFPASTEVLVHDVTWRSYSPTEKLSNALLSFWTPDVFRMYSINFLWGPLIATTPEARATLFDGLPPRSWSATRIFYVVFLLAGIGATAYAWNKPDRKRIIVSTLAIAGAALWITFDVRMTQEIASYVFNDWNTYILAPKDSRTLRSHAALYDVLAETKDVFGEEPSYVLLTEQGTPFFANARYVMYPSVPVTPDTASGTSAWIILGDPLVSLISGSLLRDGKVLSEDGTLVKRFFETSFLYRSRP